VRTVRAFLDSKGNSNPEFKFNQNQRRLNTPAGMSGGEKITRGYIRRTDQTDDVGTATLNFMFNPEQITRDYVSYLDQAALDPFNTLYQSGNLVAPPSFVNFTFSLFFDRAEDVAMTDTKDPNNPLGKGVLIDYEYFDLVVRNVVPSRPGSPDVPDNGVMMVNPKDITVVFSEDLTVQGRPTNARVSFTKFDHRMVPVRMQVDLTMITTYFGPFRSSFGLDVFKPASQYDPLVPYTSVIETAFSSADLETAIKQYEDGVTAASNAGGGSPDSYFSKLLSSSTSSSTSAAVAQYGGASLITSAPNGDLRLKALQNAYTRTANNPAYSQAQGMRTGPNSYDCSGLVWRCYEDLGAGKILAGTSYAPSTEGIAAYQNANNWKTMPIVVRGGVDNATVRQQAKSLLQPGDVLLRREGSKGHIAFFAGWNESNGKAKLVHARGTGKGCGTQERDLEYICRFNWMTRPTLGGSQSAAAGVA
jgi:hypothetical protein